MIGKNWSGQQDLNLHQVIDLSQPDSDNKGRTPVETRSKGGSDSDLFDILVASLLTHPPANPRARARFEAACEAVPEPEPDEEIEEDGASGVTVADDPLLAKLRAGAR